jgi:AAA domain-containing protein
VREVTLREFTPAEWRREFGMPEPADSVLPFDPLHTKRQTETEKGLGFQTLAELWNMPSENIRYVVNDLLPASGSSILAATPKTGKSTLIRNVLFSVVRGEDVFWRKVVAGPVLYLGIEELRDDAVEHFKLLGATPDDPISIKTGRTAYPLEEAIKRLADSISQHSAKFAVIDPLFKFIKLTNINDYMEVSDALGPLHDLSREIGCHICALHHINKSNFMLGSTAIAGAVDTILEMRKERTEELGDKPPLRYLQAEEIRYGKPIPVSVLEWKPGPKTLTLGATKYNAAGDELSRAILAYVRENPGAEHNVIKDNVSGDATRKGDALTKLCEPPIPKLRRDGSGRKNSPRRYWTVEDDSETETGRETLS